MKFFSDIPKKKLEKFLNRKIVSNAFRFWPFLSLLFCVEKDDKFVEKDNKFVGEDDKFVGKDDKFVGKGNKFVEKIVFIVLGPGKIPHYIFSAEFC